jgi:hypothetical protein
MTLKIYVSQDTKGKEWAPDTPHEVSASEWMLKKAWLEFHHLQETYAILVNLQHPSADMVVITERGLGVLELKHVFGEIKIDHKGIWMAGTYPIKAGTHLNPREQVRAYAIELRNKVIRWIFPPYMQTRKDKWSELKFQTGVCFTNPNANIQKAQNYTNEHRPTLEPWESNFSIINMDGFTAWVRELRFELKHDRTRKFDPVRLEPGAIMKIVTQLLDSVEWDQIYSAMPTGNPYAYLILEDRDAKQVFHLVKERSIIGRRQGCEIMIPERYGKVSKEHCLITRTPEGIFITDEKSLNGTYIEDQPIRHSTKLEHGTLFTLGSLTTSDKVCALRFEVREQANLNINETEQATKRSNLET